MFDNTYSFVGKHADYVRRLTNQIDTSTGHKIFERNLDVYLIAPIIGFIYGKKSKIDSNSSIKPTKIFLETLNTEKYSLTYNYRLLMLLADKEVLSHEERINRAFRYDANPEKRSLGDEIFNEYVLGGVELLYEKIMDNATEEDDYLNNIYEFISDFNTRYYEEISDVDLNELLKMVED